MCIRDRVCGVWCVVCGVSVCGVWCVVCGVWCVRCGVSCGVWGARSHLEGVGEQLSLLASDRVHLATALAIPPHALVGRPRVALAGVALAQRRLPVERRDQRGGPLVAHDLVLLQVGVRAGDGHPAK
eukprot:5190272-Prymnesium_polylepis.1